MLWRCWLGGRKGIQPVKTEWWGAVWGKVQICTWPSWSHCHSLSLAPGNSDGFWFYPSGSSSPRHTHTHMHMHTHTFYGPLRFCLGLPRWAGTRKVKPIWIYWSKRQWVAVALGSPRQNPESHKMVIVVVVVVFNCICRVTISAVTWQMNRKLKWRLIWVLWRVSLSMLWCVALLLLNEYFASSLLFHFTWVCVMAQQVGCQIAIKRSQVWCQFGHSYIKLYASCLHLYAHHKQYNHCALLPLTSKCLYT